MTANLTDGFDQFYRPTAERETRAFEEGLIVLDANVLLHVMRYSPTAREELLGVIEAIADRCFVPHQIALEYNRNRVRVVADRRSELDAAATEIDDIRSKVRKVVNNLRDRRTLSQEEVGTLEAAVTDFFAALEAASSDAADQYDLDADRLVGQVDEWTARLERALTEKVAPPPDDQVHGKDVLEADRRRGAGLAPGFKDKAGGDYLWWAEVMRCESLSGKPLVVVSDDAAKGDWRYEMRGIPVGPHSILADDVRQAGGTDLVLLTTRDLLRLAEQAGASPVSESTLAESEKVLVERREPWSLAGYVALIRALAHDGYHTRAAVIRSASNAGGHLDRSDVYEIIGASEDERSLRQFATPVQRLTTSLVAKGLVSPGVEAALWAEYDGPGKAIGYSTPTEFGPFERVLSDAERIVRDLAATDWESREQVMAQMRTAIRRSVLAHVAPDDAGEIAESLLAWAVASRADGGSASLGATPNQEVSDESRAEADDV
ncbi:PIN-like domain-containing protein [Nostocoides veronense]|uniref:PIN like domain-containing protein n=1 Tax=Nostocoides veronense TaxID=330836 RepID=A0ABN2LL56_9MICO